MRHSLDQIIRARQDYAESKKTTKDICREQGMSQDTLMYWVDGGPAEGEGHLPPIPRRRGGIARTGRRRRLRGDRSTIVRRLWRTADAQVRDIEERLMQDRQQPGERESDARLMAVLVKTLRDLCALNDTETDKAATTDTAGNDDDIPRDMDEFRRALARRMDAFIERRTGAGLPGK